MGPAALLLAREQAGVDELLHVVADGGLTDAERLGEVARADRLAALGGYVGEEPEACGVGQRLEQGGDPFGVDGVDRARGQRAALVGVGRRRDSGGGARPARYRGGPPCRGSTIPSFPNPQSAKPYRNGHLKYMSIDKMSLMYRCLTFHFN